MRGRIKYTKQKSFDKQIEGEKKALISNQLVAAYHTSKPKANKYLMLSGARSCRSNS